MAQPNVMREPSMDEILASIRRIIESNDPVPSGIGSGMPEPEGFSGSAANDDMEDVPLTIDDAFGPIADAHREPPRSAFAASHPLQPRHEQIEPMSEARLRAAQEAEDAAHHLAATREQEAASQPKSLSLADVAARVRAASERNPGLRDLAPKPAEDDAVAASNPLMTGRLAAAGGAVQAERASVDWNEIAPPVEHQASVEQARVEQPRVPEPQMQKVEDVPTAVEIEPEVQLSQPAANDASVPSSLISIDAGQQVARSFQDLAVAIDEAERRSYDDIAADLLRPMLQEWLDENLPTLVERLVREEIERVARGNRR